MAYTTVAAVRALPYMGNAAYTDEVIEEGIAFATEMIDSYTGTSFEAKSQTFSFVGNGGTMVWLDTPFLSTISTITESGVSLDVADFHVTPDGYYLVADAQWFDRTKTYTVTGTGGFTTTVPTEIQIAARTIAAKYVKGLRSALPDGTIQVVTDQGTILVAQPGVRGPTGMPEVNAILNRYTIDPRYF